MKNNSMTLILIEIRIENQDVPFYSEDRFAPENNRRDCVINELPKLTENHGTWPHFTCGEYSKTKNGSMFLFQSFVFTRR